MSYPIPRIVARTRNGTSPCEVRGTIVLANGTTLVQQDILLLASTVLLRSMAARKGSVTALIATETRTSFDAIRTSSLSFRTILPSRYADHRTVSIHAKYRSTAQARTEARKLGETLSIRFVSAALG